GVSMWRIAPIALQLGLIGYVIPFMFVYFPELIGIGITSFGMGARILLTLLLAGICLAIFLENFLVRPLKWYERVLFLFSFVLLLLPSGLTDIYGLILFVGVLVFHFNSKNLILPN